MSYRVYLGDCRQRLAELPTGSVQAIVTSPPYFGLRDYGAAGQLGLEPTPAEFVAAMVAVFREAHRVLANDGTVWLNLGDSYAHSTVNTDSFRRDKAECGTGKLKKHGLKTGNLIGIPWRVAFALQEDGWYLRQDIIWHKPNPMPSPVKSRCTSAHEYIFLLSKKKKYYFDNDAMQEPSTGREPGNVSHKHTADYEAGNEQSRLKGGLVAYAQKKSTRPRVNEADRKALRTDTENRHRSSVPGGQSLKTERPQLARARELVAEHGLTDAHIEAIRACGLSDAGKNRQTQTGTDQNTPEQQALAAYAKEKLGGYYREFLLGDTRNKRSVWTVATQPYAGAHFATFPPELIRPCILAGSRPGDVVLDPFAGSGTTLAVAVEEGRTGWGIELNPDYVPLIHDRMGKVQTKIQFPTAA